MPAAVGSVVPVAAKHQKFFSLHKLYSSIVKTRYDMAKTAKNLLIIMSDEHNPKMLGCAGHPIVETPNLDRLAAGGVRFSSAYCTSPVCIPARASFAVGKYI